MSWLLTFDILFIIRQLLSGVKEKIWYEVSDQLFDLCLLILVDAGLSLDVVDDEVRCIVQDKLLRRILQGHVWTRGHIDAFLGPLVALR